MIEVKGRSKGAKTVTVSKNEILTALNKPNDFFLALVEVDGEQTYTVYLQKPPFTAPDFAETCRTFDIGELIWRSEEISCFPESIFNPSKKRKSTRKVKYSRRNPKSAQENTKDKK